MNPHNITFNTISLWLYLTLIILFLYASPTEAQIAYDSIGNKNISFGSYGRVGVDWSFDSGRTIGRRMIFLFPAAYVTQLRLLLWQMYWTERSV